MNRDLRLSADAFLSLVQVFKKNGWEIPDENAGLESRFNRFCERLSMFNSAEQHLIIELTQRFVVIDGNDYPTLLLKLLDHIREDEAATFKDVDKFFIFPLVAPEDIEKTKSSNFVWYYFQNEHIKYNPIFLDKTLVYCDIHKISWAKNLKQNQKVILLDDYIGSGETAVNALKWFCNDYKIPAQNIIILSIAAQEIGIKHIQKELGVDVFSYYIFKRGISDYYMGDALPSKT
ncbi:hypothetical protein SDC9_134010 [bioreactor metagenome]|uniref:PRTase-CE domain-containing protein n=1 Tax=bioreactor metagenome TaxID=1076179 RepID=A0A645DCH5_9ZZZZ